MFNEELIDVVNSGNAWALVGSGPSIMAKGPTWMKLATECRDACPTSMCKDYDNARFTRFTTGNSIPAAFNYLEHLFDRQNIEGAINSSIAKLKEPSAFHREIARWPFAGYITTNYDTLLELALEQGKHGAWVSVGNTAPENKLIEQESRNIVWHPHGIANASKAKARLIVSGNDYDDLYATGSSLTIHALDSLLRIRRIVIFGFGFNDMDLLRVLERISRVTTPDKPAFAFLANCVTENEFREKYKVDVLSYTATDHDHSDILHQLDIYRSFIPTCTLGQKANNWCSMKKALPSC